jgi:large conductance mechanosensitive channel
MAQTKATANKKTATSAAARAKQAAASAKAAAVKAEATAAQVKRFTGKGAGFIDFIRTQGVIGLAVGLAIGTAAGDTVKKLVEGFINPIVQFIVGSRSGLEAATAHAEIFGRGADFKWGAFVSSAITLLATAFVIYLIIHVAKLDRLDKKKDA